MKLKTSIIIGGLCMIIGLLGFSTFQTNRLLKEERERVSRYYGMFKENEAAKDALQVYADSIQVIVDKYMYLVDSLEVLVETNYTQISYLKEGLNNALEDIQNMTPNEHYQYLQVRYPYGDSLEYLFTKEQVGYLTSAVITLDYTDSLYANQIDVSVLQAAQLGYKDEIIRTLQDENADLNLKAQELHDAIAVKLEDLQYSEEEIARLKKALRMWQGGSIGAAGFVVLILLLL